MPVGFYWSLLALVPLVGTYSVLGARAQNWLLIAVSMALMASFDVRFPLIIILTTGVAYAIVRQLDWARPDQQRRIWLTVGLCCEVGVLLWFRYSPRSDAGGFGGSVGAGHTSPLGSLAAPVGLSFYTLARMTHTFDVYYRYERPCRSFAELLTFTSFFPLLLSGPIERSSRLLPVLARRRTVDIDGVYQGAWLVLLGLFQKVVIADRCAELVPTFLRPHGGAVLTVLGLSTYAMQIYADFSGYSDIARGVARLFGIEVMANFRAPYFSRNLPEYWRRWHISLSTWLEDYVYKPSGMWLREWGVLGALAATLITFFVSALWHGHGPTFLCWGAIHASGVAVFMTTRGIRKRLKSALPVAALQVVSSALTFLVVCFAYAFFRAPDVGSAFATLSELARLQPVNLPVLDDKIELVALTGSVVAVHYLQLHDAPDWLRAKPVWVRAAAYAALSFFVVRLPGSTTGFIYFQF